MANAPRDKAYDSWKKFLNPEKLKANLARASTFLAAYELLHSSVVDKLRGFFQMGFRNGAAVIGPAYKKEVTDLYPKDVFHASCLWFQKMGAITQDDVSVIEKIRHHRNDIAHELPKYLADADHEVNMHLLDSIDFLLGKIDRWWIREADVMIGSNDEPQSVDGIPDNQIHSGSMIAMDIIRKIVHGQEKELAELYDQLLKTGGKKKP
jgi:hypothetical protein